MWEVLQEYQPHAQKEPEKHDSEPDHHTEPEAEMGIEPGKESAEMESEPIRNCEMEPQQQLSAKSTPKKVCSVYLYKGRTGKSCNALILCIVQSI